MTDERLDEGDKALHLLDKGFGLQRTSVLASLPHILSVTRNPAVVKGVMERAHALDEEQMLLLGQSLDDCLRKELVLSEDLPHILQVAEFVLDYDSEVTCELWAALLALITARLKEDEVQTLAVPLVLQLCNYARPVFVRKAGVGLLGVISAAIPETFPTEILEKINLLTQDTSYEVRKCICMVLPKVLSDLGRADELFYLVERLVTDEEMAVKRTAVGLLGAVMQLLSSEVTEEKAVPLILTEVLPVQDSEYQSNLIKCTGQFLSTLCNYSQHHSVFTALLDRFQTAFSSEPLKFAGLTAFCDVTQSVSTSVFDFSLRPIYLTLSTDPNPSIRQLCASLFPRLIPYFSTFPEDVSQLATGFLTDNECKWITIRGMKDWPQNIINERIIDLLKDAVLTTTQWRKQVEILQTLQKFLSPVISIALHEQFLPSLLRLLHSCAACVRMELTSFLLHLLYNTYSAPHRQSLLTHLLEDFAQSRVFIDRVTYIEFALSAAKLLSGDFFKRHFVRPLLSLAVDSVVAVRIRLAMGLDTVKWAIAGDEPAESLLHEALVRLCEDASPLVTDVASETQGRLINPDFVSRLESGQREKEEEQKLGYERSLDEYERTVEEQRRRRIIEDIAAKTRVSHIKDKQHSFKRNSLKIPKAVVTTKSRSSFSEDRLDSPRAPISPKVSKVTRRYKK